MDERPCVQVLPGECVPHVDGELAQERALRPPVALAEWVDGIDLGVVVGEPLSELLTWQAAEVLLGGELA